MKGPAMTEVEQLRKALRDVEQAISWYFAAHGCVSHDDMVAMIRDVSRHIDAARDVIYTSDVMEAAEPQKSIDNNL